MLLWTRQTAMLREDILANANYTWLQVESKLLRMVKVARVPMQHVGMFA